MQIGRYVLLTATEASNENDLHEAFDPDLDRRVPLRLLGSESAAQDALALVQLHHTHILPVHDVRQQSLLGIACPRLHLADRHGDPIAQLGADHQPTSSLRSSSVLTRLEDGSCKQSKQRPFTQVERESASLRKASPQPMGDVAPPPVAPAPPTTLPPSSALVSHAPTEKKPLYKKWWFWLVLGGATAAAATAVAVGVTVGKAGPEEPQPAPLNIAF